MKRAPPLVGTRPSRWQGGGKESRGVLEVEGEEDTPCEFGRQAAALPKPTPYESFSSCVLVRK